MFCTAGGPRPARDTPTPPPPPPRPEAILVHSLRGILSITYENSRKAICDDGFSDNGANIAC